MSFSARRTRITVCRQEQYSTEYVGERVYFNGLEDSHQHSIQDGQCNVRLHGFLK